MLRGLTFVVVRGPALAGKTAVTRALAERMPGKVAVVSQDDLCERWITGHDEDLARETELVYRQMRLLATSYIRNRYHVVVDGAFAAYRDGVAARHDADLRELLGLVSTIRDVRPLLVSVVAPLDRLRERARTSDRWDGRTVEAMHHAFEANALPSPLVLDTSALSPDDGAGSILEHLGGSP
jgi:hypothetical protein